MFKAEVEDETAFHAIFGNLSDMAEHFMLEYSQEGLSFSILDRAHVCFLHGQLEAAAFSKLEGSPGYSIISADELRDVLSIARSSLQLTFQGSSLQIKGQSSNGAETEYTLPEYDEDVKTQEPPAIEPEETAEVPIDFLKTAIKNSERIGSSVFLITTADSIQATAENYWQYSSKLKAPGSFKSEQTVQIDPEKLKIFTKFSKLSKEATLGLSENMPLEILIQNETSKIRGLIAPRLGETS